MTDEEVEKIIKRNMNLQMNLAGIRADFEEAPQRQWVGLTDEERKDLCRWWSSPMDAIYATETKLKEKNT
jgi:hypothetical protein